MSFSFGAIAILLLILSLWLFIAIDWFVARRTHARIQAALAEEDDEPTQRFTLIRPAPPNSEGLAAELARGRLWNMRAPRTLDGGEVIIETHWGKN